MQLLKRYQNMWWTIIMIKGWLKRWQLPTEKSIKRYLERNEYKEGDVVLLTNWISKLNITIVFKQSWSFGVKLFFKGSTLLHTSWRALKWFSFKRSVKQSWSFEEQLGSKGPTLLEHYCKKLYFKRGTKERN